MMFNGAPLQYDMFQYGTTPSSYFPATQTVKLSADFDDMTALDQADRRKRRSGSSSSPTKDKDSITNMHLVRFSSSFWDAVRQRLTRCPETSSPESSLSTGIPRAEGKARQRPRASTGRSPRKAPGPLTVIHPSNQGGHQIECEDCGAYYPSQHFAVMPGSIFFQ